MIAELAPFFPGPLRRFAVGITATAPAAHAEPGTALEDPSALVRRLTQYANALGATASPYLPALASWWSRQHCLVVVPPVLVAAAALGHRLEVALDDVNIAFDQQGCVSTVYLASSASGGPARTLDECLAPLVERQLTPLFVALARLTRVSTRVLWSHAAEIAHRTGAVLAQHPDVDCGRRRALIAWLAQDIVAGKPHPLRSPYRPRMARSDGSADEPVRRVCCLKYRLPHEEYCGVCPLLQVNGAARRTA